MEMKNAPTSAATLTGTVDSGAVCKAAQASANEFTTSIGKRQIGLGCRFAAVRRRKRRFSAGPDGPDRVQGQGAAVADRSGTAAGDTDFVGLRRRLLPSRQRSRAATVRSVPSPPGKGNRSHGGSD